MNIKHIQKINQHVYYGWVILFFSAMSYFFSSPGQTYSISVFIDAYIREFDYNRTLISSIYSLATIGSGITMVFVGRLIDLWGSRKVLLLVGSLLAMTCFYNSLIANFTMLFLSFYMLRVLGQGSLTLIPSTIVPQWFDKKKAFAMSILSLGTILGNFIVPFLNHRLLECFGWRLTWIFWGVNVMLLFIPTVMYFMIDKPEDIGLLPDNAHAKDQNEVKRQLEIIENTSFTMIEAMKTKEFWIVGLISSLVPLISTGMMFHFYSIMLTKGLNRGMASIVIGLVALPGFIVPIIARVIIDRFKPKYILMSALSIVAIVLFYMTVVSNLFQAIVFILVYGMATSVVMVTNSIIWPDYFGRKHLGSIKGAATVFIVTGSAFGAIPFGMNYDYNHSYTFAFIAMGCISILGVLGTVFISKPQKMK